MSDETRYRLVQDEDGHWYIISEDYYEEWDNWAEAYDLDDTETWDVPDCAVRIDSPFSLTFSEPREE